jgi:hypothetical protein
MAGNINTIRLLTEVMFPRLLHTDPPAVIQSFEKSASN